MPRKVRELIQDLERVGFLDRGGKGGHRNLFTLEEFLDSFPAVSREQAVAALEAAHEAVSARLAGVRSGALELRAGLEADLELETWLAKLLAAAEP